MRAYWHFFRRESPLLTYGISLTFLSSVGQTFLISLFVPHFLDAFGLTEGTFGLLYSGATLGSAALLPWAGTWLDRSRLHRFTAAVAGLVAGSAFLLASAGHVAVLGAALLGLRLGGQGLSSHAALTAMARYYRAVRGKALSVASLGFPLGEAVLPLGLTAAIAGIGWRSTWTGMGAAVLISIPLLVRLLRHSGVELDPGKLPEAGGETTGQEASNQTRSPAPHWSRYDVLRDPTFWLVLPATVLPAFWVTGIFLYQTRIAELKGWSAPLMASAFVGFAVARIVVILGTGEGIDRGSVRRLFPLSVVPMGIGIAFLWLLDSTWVAHAFMTLLGITMGMSGAVQTALWAELYGTRHLGAIKTMMGSVIVVSTAASPPLVGFVVEGGGLDSLLAGGVASTAIAAVLALRVYPTGRGSGRRGR